MDNQDVITKQLADPELDDTAALPNLPSPLSPSDTLREKYRQTRFRTQLNAVLRNHRKSQCKKILTDWPSIETRLRSADVGVKIINILKDEYHEGYKTWDGTALPELSESLQNSVDKVMIKAEAASSKLAVVPLKWTASAKTQKLKNKESLKKTTKVMKAKSGMKPKVQEDHYDSADGEYTAAKTVSPYLRFQHRQVEYLCFHTDMLTSFKSVQTRHQYATSIASGGRRGGWRGRGRGRG